MGSVDILVAGIGTGGTITGTGRYLNMRKETIQVWAIRIIFYMVNSLLKKMAKD